MAQSREIGLDTAGVADTFYPGDMAEIRRKTAPPAGCFLVAGEDADFVGSASFRPLGPGACEMHDVWVSPAHRGRSIGATLVEGPADLNLEEFIARADEAMYQEKRAASGRPS